LLFIEILESMHVFIIFMVVFVDVKGQLGDVFLKMLNAGYVSSVSLGLEV